MTKNLNCKNRTVFIGDNREVMLGLNAEIADAIITDPPFNSGQMRKDDKVKIDKKKSANLPYPVDEDGVAARAYKDQWKIGDLSKRELEYIKYKDKDLVRFCQIIGNQHSDGMEAYLLFMASRLLLCHELLKETGSIFLHCNESANSYLRMLMDAIFGEKNFRNEIIWCYTGPSAAQKQFPRKHETIFWYSKSENWNFNADAVKVPYSEATMRRRSYSEGARSIISASAKTKGKRGREAAEAEFGQGKVPESWWTGFGSGGQMSSKERCKGWDSQKPLALYTRLVRACTKSGDLVIDPFCGCATTLIAAENAGCCWIGIDNNPERITMLNEQFEKLTLQDLWKGKVHIKEIKSKRDLPKRKDNRPPKKKMEDFKAKLLKKQRKFEGQHHYYHYCAICKNPFSEEYLEIDHIYAKAEGGEWILKNLQLLCSRCNRRKGSTKTNEQVEKELRAEGLLFHQRAAVHAYTGIPAEEYLKKEEGQEEEPKKKARRKPKEDLKRRGASRQINIVL